MSPAPDVWRLLSSIQDELRRAGVQLTELRSMLAAEGLTGSTTKPARCPECGQDKGNRPQLHEHRVNAHGVGEPV